LTAQGIDVVVLERGVEHRGGAEARVPSQRDELRWAQRQGNMQNWQRETYTLRHSRHEESLPVRWMEAFLPGEGVGGAGSHWNGVAWRWSEYDPMLRTRYESRYGKKVVPADMPLQDWGTTYAEMEPYHDLFEKLFGLSGKAGNIAGTIQPGGNPFEAPRRGDYPQAPLEITEAGIIFRAAAETLGLKPFPGPAANSSGDYLNPDGQRLGRCQYCGHCERFVCEAHAKGTPDRLLYPMLKTRKGFEIRTRAQVLHIDYDGRAKRAAGVRYLDLNSGEEYEQPADVVVLAAFTMTNTRLLLLSGVGAAYDPAAKFDLTLNVEEVGNELLASWEYRSDLFDDPTIERLAESFALLLQTFSHDLDCRIHEVEIVSTAERQLLLQPPKPLPAGIAAGGSIAERFEDIAKRMPGAVAIIHEQRELTYGELETRATQLAHCEWFCVRTARRRFHATGAGSGRGRPGDHENGLTLSAAGSGLSRQEG